MLSILFIIVVASYLFDQLLNVLNIRNWANHVPSEVKDIYNEASYQKAKEYAVVNFRFARRSTFFSILFLGGMLMFGGFGKLDAYLRTITSNVAYISLLFFGVLTIASELLALPFSLYKIFVIEEKFGFNKMTLKTFIADKVKGYILGAIFGVLILTILLKLIDGTGPLFWLFAWIFLSAFMLLGAIFYASWILPLFNKLTPLQDGSLRNAIERYCKDNSFPLNDLFVMDGSKRSAKANAFFSGFWKKKKIVLYDTLIANHTENELVAVLAHEIGHYKLKHSRTSLIAGILQMGMMLYVFSLIQGNVALATALGAGTNSFHIDILAFSILYSPLSELLGIGMHLLSRKSEYEADAFAKKTFSGKPLVDALKKLSADNLSNLTPHPAYVFVHYSHPTLLQRIEKLEK